MDRRKRRLALSAPFFFWLIVGLLGPLSLVTFCSLSHRTAWGTLETQLDFGAYRELLDPLYAQLILRTIAFAAANTLLVIAISFPLAFSLARLPARARRLLLTLILIPFWTNYLVRILAFADFLRWRPLGFDWLYQPRGVLASLIYNYLPFAILPLYSTLRGLDPALFEAAHDLGASRWEVFRKILWPLSRSGVVSASLLVFIPSLGEFLIPDLIGGGQVYLLGSFLQNQFLAARNWPLGSATIVLLSCVTLVGLLFANPKKKVTL